jgi:phosphomannomutase
LRGDILGLLCAEALKIEALAVPVSSNTVIESCGRFNYVQRTKIGSPYVIAEFADLAKKFKSVAGFEANGGFLLGCDVLVNEQPLKALPTRDAVLPAIMLLVAAGDKGISSLVNALPQRFTDSDRIQNFATEKSLAIIEQGKQDPVSLLVKLGFDNAEISQIDETDGLRMVLTDGRIVHLRPSGNAPELRCYAEGATYADAKESVIRSLDNIQKL